MIINDKKSLKYFLYQDKIALGKKRNRPSFFGDEIWKYQILLRKLEYYTNKKTNIITSLMRLYYRFKFHHQSIKLGIFISPNCFGPGLAIVRIGAIYVNANAKIGKNCMIHEMVTIGATNGSKNAPHLGDNIFIGTGAKIIGNIKIANNVAIGANACVVKNINLPNTTWAGVPSKQISNNGSKDFINPNLD